MPDCSVVGHFYIVDMSLNNIKKILVVRFSSIGDIVLTSPVIRCIKNQLNCEVHFVTKQKYRLVIEHSPHIDKLYVIENKISEILSKLKKENYDLVVDLHKNLRSKRLILSLGVHSITFNKINIQKWLRVQLRVNILPKKHLVDRYFEGIGKISVVDDGRGLEYFHGLTEVDIANLIPVDPFITIVLGATYLTKRIPVEKIEVILQNVNQPCVLIGGNDVADVGSRLEEKYKNAINLSGKLTLNESAAMVENSQYVVTGDTGMMHIAAAYKVPTIVFWGSTARELGMYPYYGTSSNVRSIDIVNNEINCSPCSKIGKKSCPKGHFNCMLQLDDPTILEALHRMNSWK